MASARIRYSREELLSYREISASINFQIARIPVRVPRRNHKKSTTDHEGSKSHTKHVASSSQEDLASEEVDPSSTSAASWHRVNRYQWNSTTAGGNSSHFGGPSYHPRQRFPSGPHGGDEATTGSSAATATTAPLRPAPDTRRGWHGDWSRGCAGWRQRSYSGSERSFAVTSNANNHTSTSGNSRGTGRGGGNNDDSTAPSRGRGRARGRYIVNSIHFQQPRGVATFSKPHSSGNRPMSCVGSISTTAASTTSGAGESNEDFWQDEDWESMELEEKHPTNPQQTHPTEPNSEALAGVSTVASSIDVIGQAVSGMRIHSKSCSVDPPPGFTLPNNFVLPATANQAPTEQLSSTFVSPEQVTALGQQFSSSAATNWYYIDLEGKTQGPFSNHQMAGWMANGLLPLSIEIRRDCDECFISLVDHMHLAGRVPFWDGYTKPPITRALAASLSTPNGFRWPNLPAGVSQSSGPPPSAPAVNSSGCINLLTSPVTNEDPCKEANSRLVTCDGAGDVIGPPSAGSLPPTATGFSQPQQNATASTGLVLNQPNVDCADILRLYTEAQQLVASAAKVEAERQQLADKLAAINSTAAVMLLASAPSRFPPPNQPTLSHLAGPMDTVTADVCPTVDNLVIHNQVVASHSVNRSGDSSKALSPVPGESVQLSGVVDTMSKEKVDEQEEDDDEDLDGADQSFPSQELKVDVESTNIATAGEAARKLKKKKKPKKPKSNADQERLSAWEAEFERRKAAARERQLAEEAELAALAAEEAAALAEEQARVASEQARVLNEQRRREAQRIKAGQQLSHLQLPTSAKWGGAGGGDVHITVPTHASVSHTSSYGSGALAGKSSNSLLAIQAAQASEEAERKRQESLLAEQEAAALAAAAVAAASASKQRSTAWSTVVQPETKPSLSVSNSTSAVRQLQHNANSKPNRVAVNSVPIKPAPETVTHALVGSPPMKADRSKTTGTAGGTHVKPMDVNTAAKTVFSPTTATSIWDLPVGGTAAGSGLAVGKQAKKHNKKKNTQCSREAACFAAKEELAHWCEAQLSSLPLPSVDLPTLVDLLCELEATDQTQVVEFIESSLGRSKQISKFSKAFLEKRACVLKARP